MLRTLSDSLELILIRRKKLRALLGFSGREDECSMFFESLQNNWLRERHAQSTSEIACYSNSMA
jgi:hypothetical protein